MILSCPTGKNIRLYLGEWNPRLWGIAEVHNPVYLTTRLLELEGALNTYLDDADAHPGTVLRVSKIRAGLAASAITLVAVAMPARTYGVRKEMEGSNFRVTRWLNK
eukprot:6379669-Pyramimonas_sp.AAC.1